MNNGPEIDVTRETETDGARDEAVEAELAASLFEGSHGPYDIQVSGSETSSDARRFHRLCSDIRDDASVYKDGVFRLYTPAPMRRAALALLSGQVAGGADAGGGAPSPFTLDAHLLILLSPFLRNKQGEAIALADLQGRTAYINLDEMSAVASVSSGLKEVTRALRSCLVRSRSFAFGMMLANKRRALGPQSGLSSLLETPFTFAPPAVGAKKTRRFNNEDAVEAICGLYENYRPFEERFWRFEASATAISVLLSGFSYLSADILQAACAVPGADKRLREALGDEVDSTVIDRLVVDGLYPETPDVVRGLIALVFEHKVIERRTRSDFEIVHLERDLEAGWNPMAELLASARLESQGSSSAP